MHTRFVSESYLEIRETARLRRVEANRVAARRAWYWLATFAVGFVALAQF